MFCASHLICCGCRACRLVDEYIRELRNASLVAQQLALRHDDPRWRAAAADVATAAAKYESHFFGNKATYQKLKALIKQLDSGSVGAPSAQDSAAAAGDADSNSSASSSDGSSRANSGGSPGSAAVPVDSASSTSDTRVLAAQLTRAFERRGAPLEDGWARLVCLEAADEVKAEAQRLWRLESELCELIASRLADPRFSPVLDARPFLQSGHHSASSPAGSAGSGRPARAGEQPVAQPAAGAGGGDGRQPALDEASASDVADAAAGARSDSCVTGDATDGDAVLLPLCRWIPDDTFDAPETAETDNGLSGSGNESGHASSIGSGALFRPVVVLTRANAAALLQRHPDTQIRR